MNSSIIIDRRLGGKPRYYLTPPKDYGMYIPDDILKCVVFLCIEETKNGKIVYTPRGTGFLVVVPFESGGSNGHTYLVTARHNIEKIVENGISWDKIRIRTNDVKGKAVEINLGASPKWVGHPDHANEPVDAMVIYFNDIDDDSFDIKAIPINMFLTKQNAIETIISKKIGVGNDAFIIGLFSKHHGKEKNFPIVRVGNVAMMSDEKVYTTRYGDMDSYLVEVRSIKGLSGSPVFFRPPSNVNGAIIFGDQLFFGGLIHGHWDVPEDDIDVLFGNENDEKKEEQINVGIAIVTPAQKILEILEQDELKKERTRIEKEHKENTAPTTED